MGIERFFNSIKSKYNIVKDLKYPYKKIKTKYLFFDFNSIIHNISQKIISDINKLYAIHEGDIAKNSSIITFFDTKIKEIKKLLGEKKRDFVSDAGDNLSGKPIKINKYNENSLAYINLSYYIISILSMSFFISLYKISESEMSSNIFSNLN